MNGDKEVYTKLENVLKKAFLGKEKAEPSAQWQENVMRRVRNVGPLNATTGSLDLFEQFLWRFAPIACVLIIVLTCCIIYLGLVPEYEVVELFIKDPIEFSYVQMFEA
jgi:hypothetical protein